MDRRALLHFFFEHLSNHARVSFAARFFHNLANEEADSFILTGLVVSNGLRVLSNGFFNQLKDSAFITNLLQPELLNEDAFGQFIAKIKVTEIDEASLLTAEEYEKLLEEA